MATLTKENGSTSGIQKHLPAISGANETTLYVDSSDNTHQQPETGPVYVSRETALKGLNTIVQVHFEKTLEKKRAVDLQKKELWKFQLFFVFLTLIFGGIIQSSRLECRHCWIPIFVCGLGHVIFYVAMSQTLRCINGCKYQRRCHKLTLAMATERLKRLKLNTAAESVAEEEFQVHYQEPSHIYLNKFKIKWALHLIFVLIIFSVMNSSITILLCQ